MENFYSIYLQLLKVQTELDIWSVITIGQKQDVLSGTVEKYIQDTVSLYQYIRVDRIPLYEQDPIWGTRAEALKKWNSDVWKKSYEILDECRLGRPIPTPSEMIAELPIYVE